MIVSCPACESRFEVDQSQIGFDGRVVRCGKCGNCWHQMPDNDPRSRLSEEAESPFPPPPRRHPAATPKRSKTPVFGWVILLLFVAGVAAGGWFERERIVQQFPQLRDAYNLLGIPVGQSGPVLELGEVTTESESIDGARVLTVRGVVSNISDQKQTLPPLRVQLTDSEGKVVAEWTFETPQSELDAGGVMAFESQTTDPPRDARDLSINFAR